jgi:hypothetical protein
VVGALRGQGDVGGIFNGLRRGSSCFDGEEEGVVRRFEGIEESGVKGYTKLYRCWETLGDKETEEGYSVFGSLGRGSFNVNGG